MVISETGLSGCTMTAIPSSATTIIFGSNPLFRARVSSLSFISLETCAMSQVLFRREEIPVPEPPPVTAMERPGWVFINSSAHAWVRLTMVSEPLIWIMVFPLSVFRPHPGTRSTSSATVSSVVVSESLEIIVSSCEGDGARVELSGKARPNPDCRENVRRSFENCHGGEGRIEKLNRKIT